MSGELVEERFRVNEQTVPLSHYFLWEAREEGFYCNVSLILPLILNNYFFTNSCFTSLYAPFNLS